MSSVLASIRSPNAWRWFLLARNLVVVTATGAGVAWLVSRNGWGPAWGGAVVASSMWALACARWAKAARGRPTPRIPEWFPLLEELQVKSSAEETGHALARVVGALFGCEQVEVVLTRSAAEEAAVQEQSATRKIADYRRMSAEWELPLTFRGHDMGMLRIGPRFHHHDWTDDERSALAQVVHQASIALYHATMYEQVEVHRGKQSAAWRQERVALAETIAAEITHEVRYPLNYFRSIFSRSAHGYPLTADDVEVGWEEVERLERMVSGLRRMAAPHVERGPASIHDLCARAEVLLRDGLCGRRLQLDISDPPYVSCDVDKLTQVLVNLLANALEAAGERGTLGVRWHVGGCGAELSVWDDGPGFPGGANRLFTPWFTTKPKGSGLGLAISQRLIRAHGWSIDALRNEGRTVFVVRIPPADVVTIQSADEGQVA